MTPLSAQAISEVCVRCFSVPTSQPEADGTLEWSKTDMVLATVHAGEIGLGYSYTHPCAAELVRGTLRDVLIDQSPSDMRALHYRMQRAVRNYGREGLSATAISALDMALWDLRAKLLIVPLTDLLGNARRAVPAYASGGFTSYDRDALTAQLGGWKERGFRAVKMKIGAQPLHDLERVHWAREAIGPDVALFVDANGAYRRKQALRFAEELAELGVTWFEEPVSSDDLEGLRRVRDQAPTHIDIAAGEYGYTPEYFRRMLDAGAVDVLQIDATRALGVTGYLDAAAVSAAAHVPISAHTAPAIHAHLGCATRHTLHVEYFYDHARIEDMLFDGLPRLTRSGELEPDRSRPGHGLVLKEADAHRYETTAPPSRGA